MTETKINPEYKKIVDKFWLYWGLSPNETQKHKAGQKALDFIYDEFFNLGK